MLEQWEGLNLGTGADNLKCMNGHILLFYSERAASIIYLTNYFCVIIYYSCCVPDKY